MADEEQRKSSKPVMPGVLFALMTLIVLGGIGGVGYGFYTGMLAPYWTGLSDAHAAIISQVIFFVAAAWAAVAVPFLFGGQLRTMEEAAERAEQTSKNTEALMKKIAADSEAQLKQIAAASEEQFKSIMRLQLMSLGHLVDPAQLEIFRTQEEKKEFVRAAWTTAKQKLEETIRQDIGQRQNALGKIHKYSTQWWDKLAEFGTARECFDHFKLIHTKSRRQTLELADLKEVNEASLRIENFEASAQVTETTPDAVAAQLTPPMNPTAINNGGQPPAQSWTQ